MMKNRKLTVAIPFAGAIVAATGCAEIRSHSPNVIIIYADDIGYGDLSCNGTAAISTPNVDSLAGKIASVMMGSTETTFYTMAVYFGCVGIKHSRHTLRSALTADATGMMLSVVIVQLLLA